MMKRYAPPNGFSERDAALYVEWDGEAAYRVRKVRDPNNEGEEMDGRRERASWLDRRFPSVIWVCIEEMTPWSLRGLS